MKRDTRVVRAILYLRLSDLRDDDLNDDGAGKTFADREQDLRDEAEELGWDVVGVVVENDVSSPDGKHRPASAFKRRKVTLPDGTRALRTIRPGFRKILGDFESGYATGLLAEDGDRIARDPRDGEDLLDVVEMKKLNVRTLTGVLNLTDGGTDAEVGAARDAINAANKEARKMRNRARRGRRRKARAGLYGGGKRPFGFEADGVTKRWDECEVIAVCSKRVVQIDGRKSRDEKADSLRLLAAELREADVPTVMGAKWSAETLRDILLRPRNAGISVYDGEEIGKASWEPVVPEPLFRAVVRVLTDPARRTGPGAPPKWLGSGKYRCGLCDDGTTCQVTSTGRNPRYVCKSYGHLSCNQAPTDAWVGSAIIERLSDADAIDLFGPVAPEIDTAALRSEADAIRVNLDALAEDKALGLIDREQLRKGSIAGRKRLAEIDQLFVHAAAESAVAELVTSDDVAAKWASGDLTLAVRRAILDELCTVTLMPSEVRGPRFDTNRVVIEPKRVDATAV